MKFRNKINNFMKGRYGPDELYYLLFSLYIILLIIDLFISSKIILILELIVIAFMFYRFFSKNIYKRDKENRKYLKLKEKVLKFFKKKDDKIYKKCKKCKTILRLPLPMKRGIKHAKCPHCGNRVKILVFRKQKIEIIKSKRGK